MTTGWNNRNDWFNSSDGTNDGSFEEHTERMRGFHKSHADVAMVNGPRCDKPALLESMRPLEVCHTITETGGSSEFALAAEWPALVPLWRVAQYRLSQN